MSLKSWIMVNEGTVGAYDVAEQLVDKFFQGQ